VLVRFVGRRGGLGRRWGRVRIISARILQDFLRDFAIGHEVSAALQIGARMKAYGSKTFSQTFHPATGKPARVSKALRP